MRAPYMNVAKVVVLVLCVVVYYAHAIGAGPQNGGGGGGSSVPCNVWQPYDPNLGQWPSWASNMPGCGGLCLTPGVAVTADGDTCFGGGGNVSQADTGNLYGAACPAASAAGVVPFSADSVLYYISRDPACGPWQTTTDPGAAFTFRDVPVCFPTQGPAGAIAPYVASACAGAPELGSGWQMAANDAIPAGP